MFGRLAALIVLAALEAGAAHAQNPQSAPPGQTPPPVTPRGPTTTPPEQVAPRSDGNLSESLSRNRGTVTPPAVDPGIAKRPPAGSSGSMPVIPPPGSAGGNPNVVPK
jgi:hypothetical protein